MSFETKQINKVKVKPLNIPTIDPGDIKGGELFPELYYTVYIIAPPKTGKTTVIYNILKMSIDKRTTFYGFVGTNSKDDIYNAMREMFDNKGVNYHFYTNIKDKIEKIHNVRDLIKEFKENDISDEEEEEEETELKELSIFDDEDDIRVKYKRKKYKPKKAVPKRVILFDDMSIDLRDPYVCELIKEFRHYKCVVLIASQDVFDCEPTVRANIEYYLLFPNIEERKIIDIYKKASINMGQDKFLKLYRDATNKPKNFLYVRRNNEYRKNFNERYII